jgi:hypothetical protein
MFRDLTICVSAITCMVLGRQSGARRGPEDSLLGSIIKNRKKVAYQVTLSDFPIQP